MANNNSNPGSRKPLNWQSPKFYERPAKATSWKEKIHSEARQGTPITRQGMVNGVASGLEPNAAKFNRPLTIKKALLAPPKVTVEGVSAQKPRKRDEHGRFSQTQTVGRQSTASEDSEKQEREAKLQAAKQKAEFDPKWAGKTRLGMTNTKKALSDMNVATAKPTEDTMGTTPSGLPLYDDPYHPDHTDFTAEDHQHAADMHNQAAQELTGSGNHVGAALGQQKANMHRELAADKQLPAERIMQNVMSQPGQAMAQQGAPPVNPFEAFLAPQHQEDQSGGAAQDFMARDQQKPIFQNRFSPGPKPGMINTETMQPVGLMTDQVPHAGTYQQQEQMPPEPTGSSMPDINGEEEEAKDSKVETAPFGGDAKEQKSSEAKNEAPYTKSLSNWLNK